MEDIQKVKSDFFSKARVIEEHINELQSIIEKADEELEGNCFYEHRTLTFRPELLPKQVNLFWAAQQVKNNKICEIGFNAGHSMLLFLLANDQINNISIFDLSIHKYTTQCAEYIYSKFPYCKIHLYWGDSKKKLPDFIQDFPENIEQYDLVHVDGGHTEDCVTNDIFYGQMLVSVNGLLIIDDTNVEFINSKVNDLINTGKYIEMKILDTPLYPHRILKRIV